MRINYFLTLPTRMADLCPKLIAAPGTSGGPSLKSILHRGRGLVGHNDIPRPL